MVNSVREPTLKPIVTQPPAHLMLGEDIGRKLHVTEFTRYRCLIDGPLIWLIGRAPAAAQRRPRGVRWPKGATCIFIFHGERLDAASGRGRQSATNSTQAS